MMTQVGLKDGRWHGGELTIHQTSPFPPEGGLKYLYSVSLLLIAMWFTEKKTRSCHPGHSYASSQQSRLGDKDLSSAGKLIGCIGAFPFLPQPQRVFLSSHVGLGSGCSCGLTQVHQAQRTGLSEDPQVLTTREYAASQEGECTFRLTLTPIHCTDLWWLGISFISDWYPGLRLVALWPTRCNYHPPLGYLFSKWECGHQTNGYQLSWLGYQDNIHLLGSGDPSELVRQ